MTHTHAVVFDLDGTLIDSAPDIHNCLNAALATVGASPLTPEQTRRFIGNGAPHLVFLALDAKGISQEQHSAVLAGFLRLYEHTHDATTHYPHVLETLNQLRAAGYALALCTNKPAAATVTALDVFGLAEFFPVVIAGDTLKQRKPDAAPLLRAISDLGAHCGTQIGIDQTLFVGDSEVDAATAAAAGTTFALFTEGYRKTPADELRFTRKFNDFRELPQIVQSILA